MIPLFSLFLQDEVVVPRPLLGHEAAVAAEDLGLDFRRHLVGAAAPGWRAACKEIRADDLGRHIPLRLHAVCELAHDGLAARILQVDDDKDSAGLGPFHRGAHLVEECLLLRQLDMAQVVLQEVDIGLLVDALVAKRSISALLAWHEVVAVVDETSFVATADKAVFLAKLPADLLLGVPAAFPVEDGDGRPVVELCAAQSLECAVHLGARSSGEEGQVEDGVERLAFLQGRDDIVADDAAGWLDVVRIVREHVRLAVLLGMVAAHTGLIRVLRLIALAQ